MTKRYWLWGGIVGAIISVLILYFVGLVPDWVGYVYLPAVLFDLSGHGMIIGSRGAIQLYLAFTINGFVYGAIIGWIYGKIKNKNKTVQQ